MEEAWDLIRFIGGALAALAVLFGLVVWGTSYGLSRPTCYAHTAQIGLRGSWSFWGDCQIRLKDGRWIPLENYRVVGGADQ
jgi:hypothetical protein